MAVRAPRSSGGATVAMILLMLVACTSGGQAPLADGSPITRNETNGSGRETECPSVELRGPDGRALDLSGTWIGIGERGASTRRGTYEFNLLNSCLAWVGQSAEEGEAAGTSWVNVFIGEVNADFTMSGSWAVVSIGGNYCQGGISGAFCDRARGTLVLRIDLVDTADGNKVRLVLEQITKVGYPGAVIGEGFFVTGIWVRPGDEALFDLPVD